MVTPIFERVMSGLSLETCLPNLESVSLGISVMLCTGLLGWSSENIISPSFHSFGGDKYIKITYETYDVETGQTTIYLFQIGCTC